MSRIGDMLDRQSAAFERHFGDELVVRNYTAGAKDDWDDEAKNEHPDSPQTVQGQSQVRGRPSVESEGTGLYTETDRVFFIPTDAFVTTNNDTWNGTSVDFPTEVEDTDGRVYVIVSVQDQRNGVYRCLGRSED